MIFDTVFAEGNNWFSSPQVWQSQPGVENCRRGPDRGERVPLAGEILDANLVSSGLIFLKQVGLISSSGSRRPFCGGTLVIKMNFCISPHYRALIVFRSAPKRCSQLLTAQHQGEQTMWSGWFPSDLSFSYLSLSPSGGRYPIWFNSMFEFCQKMIH